MSDTGIIYLENPHQMPPRAYAFDDEQEFTQWLRQACERKDFSYRVHDRASWDEYVAESGEEPESDWFAQWAAPGYKLFDAGASEIVEIWARGSLVALEDRKTADTEIKAMLNCLDDFHQHRVLNKEQTLRELATGGAGLSHHQNWKCLARIEECANTLGWIEEEPKADEEAEDE